MDILGLPQQQKEREKVWGGGGGGGHFKHVCMCEYVCVCTEVSLLVI